MNENGGTGCPVPPFFVFFRLEAPMREQAAAAQLLRRGEPSLARLDFRSCCILNAPASR
ncbi:protein of unknown function [Methylococcus capsulatus]|uniref:Uncharacterized protein n=1 Tax=Methylococcus capsulatus TaxID=414 RepID=A0AA35V167_METCP|nr:protein of unknown function [Methylococcus capsulatus]